MGRKYEIYYNHIEAEQGGGNYSAYAPDLPGCVAIGDTREEVAQNMKEAIKLQSI